MASVVSICNQALSRLGGNRITSIDDNSTEANLCKSAYEPIRDNVLEEHQWSFAIKRYTLPKAAEGDTKGQYANRFLIPVEVINVIMASSQPDDRVSNPDSWRIEGEYIVSDADMMYLKAIIKITDPKFYTPMFTQAFATRLAAEICFAVTHSAKLAHSLLQEYGRLLELAAQKDGQQGSAQRIRSNRYKSVRGSGGTLGPYV